MGFSDREKIHFTPWITEKMQEQLSSFTAEKLLRIVELLTQTLGEMRWSETPRIVLETKLVRLTLPTINIGELISRLEDLEKNTKNNLPAMQAIEEKNSQTYETTPSSLIPENAVSTTKPVSRDFQQNWAQFMEAVGQQKASLHAFLVEGKIQQFEDNGLQIVFSQQLHYSTVEKNRLWLENLWEKTFTQKVKIKVLHNHDVKSEKEESSSDPSVAKIVEIFHGKINH